MDTYTAAGNSTSYDISVSWKPTGRGRKFDRMARGLARKLRIPYVRRVLWERDNPQIHVNSWLPSYGVMFTSTNALADHSFACTCHKRDRYSRKGHTEYDVDVVGMEIDQMVREDRAEQRRLREESGS